MKKIILLQLFVALCFYGCKDKYYIRKFTQLYQLKSAYNNCDSNGNVDGSIVETYKREIIIYNIYNGVVDSAYYIYDKKSTKLKKIVKLIPLKDTVKCIDFNKESYYKYFIGAEVYSKTFREDGSVLYEGFKYDNNHPLTIGYYPNAQVQYIIFKGNYPDSTAYFYEDGRFAGYRLRFNDHEIEQKIIYYPE